MAGGRAWDDPVHEQPPKGGLSPVTEYAPGTGVRDSAAFRPLSSCCQGSGSLDMSDPTLSVSAIVLSLNTGACWSPPSPCAGGWAGLASSRGLPDGRTGAELLLCAPGGAVKNASESVRGASLSSYALCERHRALPERGCVLEPPVTLRG